MFIAAMSTVAKLWKEPRCPSTDEWIKKMWYIYTYIHTSYIHTYIHNGILHNHQKNEILSFATAWLELEGIMLSERSQSEKDKYHGISLICGI